MLKPFCAAATAALLSTTALAATAPKSGVYAANIYIQQSGVGCLDARGSSFLGALNYGGLSATQLGLRVPIVQQAGVAVVSTQVLKVTGGVGTTHPSGTFTSKGSGVGASWNLSGTFTATLTEIDAYSFVAQVTESYMNNGYTCNETQLIALTRLAVKE